MIMHAVSTDHLVYCITVVPGGDFGIIRGWRQYSWNTVFMLVPVVYLWISSLVVYFN